MRIKLIANPKKDWARALAKEIEKQKPPNIQIVRRGADATVCIGGDGTILYANYRGRIEGPILGIGSDKSYICQLHHEEWKDRLFQSLESKRTVAIQSIRCSLAGKAYNALNDFVVHATHYRVAELGVTIDREEQEFEGDGMIISTALGSAAYAYSAGGMVLPPTERKLSLVPICPYKRAFSPTVLGEDKSITIKAGSDCAFIVDGIFVRKLKKGEIARFNKGSDITFFDGVGK